MKKKLILYCSFCVGIILFESCSPHYAPSQPTYVEVERPTRPSNLHIWIDGDWRWNNQKKAYTRSNGHWIIPNRNRTYRPGKWNVNHRGHYWTRGRWK